MADNHVSNSSLYESDDGISTIHVSKSSYLKREGRVQREDFTDFGVEVQMQAYSNSSMAFDQTACAL